jgi:hypothetical protein
MGSLRHRFYMRNTPSSTKFQAPLDEFDDYRFDPMIQPWDTTSGRTSVKAVNGADSLPASDSAKSGAFTVAVGSTDPDPGSPSPSI